MKRLIKLFIIFFLIFSFSKVYASSLTLEDEVYYDDSLIYDITSKDNNYYLISSNEGTTIYKYNSNNELKITKNFSDVGNSILGSYNDYLYLIGKSNGFIKIYLLDQNLRTLNIKETTIPLSENDEIKIYSNDSKLYFIIVNNNALVSNIIYEVGEELDIIENNLSSLASDLKDIFGSYYEVYFNDDLKDTMISSSRNKNYGVVVGYSNDGYFLRIVKDEVEELILEDEVLDTLIINNNILLLLNNDNGLYVRILDENGNYLEDITLNIHGTKAYFRNVNRKLAIFVKEESKSMILLFNCVSDIEVEANIYGTIKSVSLASASEEVSLSVKANSGYTVKEVLVYDEYGNQIEVSNNSFIMPQGNVIVTATYEESIGNPDTIDIIFFIIAALSISFVIMYITVKKLKWLN